MALPQGLLGLKHRNTYSGVAYVIPWPLFVNQECYISKSLSRQAVFENSSCEFFRSLFKVKAKGQRSMLRKCRGYIYNS